MVRRCAWVVLMIGLLAASCQMRHTQAGTALRTYSPEELVENSRILANRLRVIQRDVQTMNGLLRVQVRVENITTKSLEFEYRYTWFDSKGFEVASPMSAWKSIQVLAKDDAFLSGVAPDETVTDFKLLVRYPEVR